MGGCHCSETERTSIRSEIRECIASNCDLVQGVIYASLQQERRGLCIKLLNIQRLTQKYYSRVNSERSAMERKECRLPNAEQQWFTKKLQDEFAQLNLSNRQLKLKYRALRQLSRMDDLKAYLLACENNTWLQYDLKLLIRVFHKFRNNLNSAVENYTGGQGLSPEEARLLMEISQATTYLFSNPRTAIHYQANTGRRESSAAPVRRRSTTPLRAQTRIDRSQTPIKRTQTIKEVVQCITPC